MPNISNISTCPGLVEMFEIIGILLLDHVRVYAAFLQSHSLYRAQRMCITLHSSTKHGTHDIHVTSAYIGLCSDMRRYNEFSEECSLLKNYHGISECF